MLANLLWDVEKLALFQIAKGDIHENINFDPDDYDDGQGSHLQNAKRTRDNTFLKSAQFQEYITSKVENIKVAIERSKIYYQEYLDECAQKGGRFTEIPY